MMGHTHSFPGDGKSYLRAAPRIFRICQLLSGDENTWHVPVGTEIPKSFICMISSVCAHYFFRYCPMCETVASPQSTGLKRV